MRRSRRYNGFTLIELMVAVAIIGILAATAVTSFQLYQWRSRRTEAYGNVGAIAKLEQSYFSEFNVYTGSGGLSWPANGFSKTPWTAAARAAFSALGFEPEGTVYYDYAVNVGCPGATCFTASAYGDADSDGLTSCVQYTQPDPLGATVPDLILGLPLPVEPGTGRVQINEVAVNQAADLY